MDKKELIQIGIDTITTEADALERTASKISHSFADSVEMIMGCKGRVVVTGMGKSGLIGKKIAATLASTGTPAFFLHPAEGVHGDLGMIVRGDIVIAISNSGETDEIKVLLPLIKRLGVGLISIVGNVNSTLAKKSDCVLDASITKEACPLNLAPTSSTTVSLALGDALAVALIKSRGFKEEDFAMLHPSGALGKRLLLTVGDLMHSGNELPVVHTDTGIKETVSVINLKRFGSTAVIDDNGAVTGIITDGDLRRAMSKYDNTHELKACDIMTKNPKVIAAHDLAASALRIMETFSISALFVLDKDRKLEGIIHLQDLLKAGLV